MFSDPKYSFSACQKYFFVTSKKVNIFLFSILFSIYLNIRSMYPSLAKVEVPSQNLAATQQFKVWTFIVIGRYLGEFHTQPPCLY